MLTITSKPRLKKAGVFWQCSSSFTLPALGITPKEAYEQWERQRLKNLLTISCHVPRGHYVGVR